jgi:hypothetical protein
LAPPASTITRSILVTSMEPLCSIFCCGAAGAQGVEVAVVEPKALAHLGDREQAASLGGPVGLALNWPLRRPCDPQSRTPFPGPVDPATRLLDSEEARRESYSVRFATLIAHCAMICLATTAGIPWDARAS